MLGSFEPWPSGPEVFRQGFDLPGVREDMANVGIHSPEALLARQLASQRTAFAVTGDGPIQSDLFPVLEYAAPRAFYFGESSQMFGKYDERTCQQLFAPAGKLAVLRSLSPEQVQSVFSEYASVNSELSLAVQRLKPAENSPWPCVFNSNSPHASIPALPPGDPTNATTLTQAVALVGGTIAQQHEAIALIGSVVGTQAALSSQPLAAWSALAATTALGLGDSDQAMQLSTLALKQDPANVQAAFILRLIAGK